MQLKLRMSILELAPPIMQFAKHYYIKFDIFVLKLSHVHTYIIYVYIHWGLFNLVPNVKKEQKKPLVVQW